MVLSSLALHLKKVIRDLSRGIDKISKNFAAHFPYLLGEMRFQTTNEHRITQKTKNMTTPLVRNSSNRSPWRPGFLLGFLLIAHACLALSLTASTVFAQANASDETSLRSAILDAVPGQTINISAGTITLTGGELVISKDLTITGQGAGVTTISGNNNSRVFFINPGALGATMPPTAPSPPGTRL
jgi:hypothetical protein